MEVCLDRYIVDILRSFGDPVDKIKEIIDNFAEGLLPLPDTFRGLCGEYTLGSVRLSLPFTQLDYPSLPRRSIRPLIYWFIENEMYDDLGWTATDKNTDELRRALSLVMGVSKRNNDPMTELVKILNETIKQYNGYAP